jgi:hypothetical protein
MEGLGAAAVRVARGVPRFGLPIDGPVGAGARALPFAVSVVALGTADGVAPTGEGLAIAARPAELPAVADGAVAGELADDGVDFGCGGGQMPTGDDGAT